MAFKDIDAAILVGSMPRKEGMERKDLLKANVAIFKTQGAALDKYAKKTVKVTPRLSLYPYLHSFHSLFFGGGEYYYISIILFSDILLKICDLISQLQLMNTGSESAYPENVFCMSKPSVCLLDVTQQRHAAA